MSQKNKNQETNQIKREQNETKMKAICVCKRGYFRKPFGKREGKRKEKAEEERKTEKEKTRMFVEKGSMKKPKEDEGEDT